MNGRFLRELIEEILSFDDPRELADFLRGILTEKELDEISTRLQIVRLLKSGMPQKEIAEKLGVGVATVTRGSKELKKGRFNNIESRSKN